MVIHRPDFVVIGAMKSATTTLHEQLARQPGFFMTRMKEPNFFSDDSVHKRGWKWYSALFQDANPGDLRGESSTHYTKLPTYPRTVDRMVRHLPHLKLIYLMRHPLDRLISQYVHEVTAGRIRVGLSEAIRGHSELVDYGRYAMQLQPFLEAYGFENILPVFFPRFVTHSQSSLERIARFLAHRAVVRWDMTLKPQNVGRDRLRHNPIREVLVQAPVLSTLRQRIVPRDWSRSLKRHWKARIDPPRLATHLAERLRELFDADLAQLGAWLKIRLDCENFQEVTVSRSHDWASTRRGGALAAP
jgi:hypothetical protein